MNTKTQSSQLRRVPRRFSYSQGVLWALEDWRHYRVVKGQLRAWQHHSDLGTAGEEVYLGYDSKEYGPGDTFQPVFKDKIETLEDCEIEEVFDWSAQVEFSTPVSVGERPWGEELLIAHIKRIATGKLLKMRVGAKGGLQKHHSKHEAQYILSGRLLFRYDRGEGIEEKILEPGDCVLIPPGAVHQEEALTDVEIFEVSSPHFNDRVRMELEYGLEIPEGGLPSTTYDEVEKR